MSDHYILRTGAMEVTIDMDDEDESYRNTLSPSEQAMIDSGRYVLRDNLGRHIDIDAKLPRKDKDLTQPFVVICQPVTLPKIWIGYYEHLKKNPLFCFLVQDPEIAKALNAPLQKLVSGGFAVACFSDEKNLERLLNDKEYLHGFDLIGLVADPSGLDILWGIRNELVKSGLLDGRQCPFACVYPYKESNAKASKSTKPVLTTDGTEIIPATIDSTLQPELFCEETIHTLYFDQQWYLPSLVIADSNAAELSKEIHANQALLAAAVNVESSSFYALLGSENTHFVREAVYTYRQTDGHPDMSTIRRLVYNNIHIGSSQLAKIIGDIRSILILKKILDKGRGNLCFAGEI